MATTRTLTAAVLALALAAGCLSGGPSAPPPAAPAETTTAAPEAAGADGAEPAGGEEAEDVAGAGGGPGGEGGDEECAVVMNPRNIDRTDEARELMNAAEALPGPAAPAQIERIAAIRWEVRWDRGCPGVWGDRDDERFDALAARTADREASARAAMETDPDALAAAEAEEDGRRGRGPDEPPPEPARSDADGECQTDAAPWACDPEPGAEVPEPPATTTPAPPATTAEPEPETPEAVENFADEAAEVPDGQAPARRQPDGPVVLGAPVLLRSLTEWLCPPEEDWRAAGWTGCGGEGPNDYLRDPEMGRCHWGPVVLGVGDSYRREEVAGDWRIVSTSTLLGFSAVTESGRPRVAWALPLRSTAMRAVSDADGSVTERNETGTAALKWVLIGGPEHRGLSDDGTLAWGTFAIPAGNRPC